MRPGCLAGSAASGTTGSTTSLASEGEVVTIMTMFMISTMMTVDVQVFNHANVFKALITFSPGELCWPSERAGDHIIVSLAKLWAKVTNGH